MTDPGYQCRDARLGNYPCCQTCHLGPDETDAWTDPVITGVHHNVHYGESFSLPVTDGGNDVGYYDWFDPDDDTAQTSVDDSGRSDTPTHERLHETACTAPRDDSGAPGSDAK